MQYERLVSQQLSGKISPSVSGALSTPYNYIMKCSAILILVCYSNIWKPVSDLKNHCIVHVVCTTCRQEEHSKCTMLACYNVGTVKHRTNMHYFDTIISHKKYFFDLQNFIKRQAILEWFYIMLIQICQSLKTLDIGVVYYNDYMKYVFNLVIIK